MQGNLFLRQYFCYFFFCNSLAVIVSCNSLVVNTCFTTLLHWEPLLEEAVSLSSYEMIRGKFTFTCKSQVNLTSLYYSLHPASLHSTHTWSVIPLHSITTLSVTSLHSTTNNTLFNLNQQKTTQITNTTPLPPNRLIASNWLHGKQ